MSYPNSRRVVLSFWRTVSGRERSWQDTVVLVALPASQRLAIGHWRSAVVILHGFVCEGCIIRTLLNVRGCVSFILFGSVSGGDTT